MSNNWEVNHNGKIHENIDDATLKKLAVSGRITRSTGIRRSANSIWFQASRVPGLFDDEKPIVSKEEAEPQADENLVFTPIISEDIPKMANKPPVKNDETRRSIVVLSTLLGIAAGCCVGFYAAHHFALFGGLMLLGRPYSEARYNLVPGHMALLGPIFGLAGFVISKRLVG